MYKLLPILLFAYALAVTTDEIYDDSWAVIIGINEYEHVDKLNYAVQDAEAIKDLLISNFNFPKEHIIMLTDKEATLDNIRTKLFEVATSVNESDRLLVYYAGHGETYDLKSGGERGYLIPVDGDLANIFATCLPMSDIKEVASVTEAKHVLFLMDACYGGLLAVDARSISKTTSGYIDKITRDNARQIITAGGKGEQVIEKSEWGHSAFAKNLLHGLKTGIADEDSDGYITADELGSFLKKRVTIDSDNFQTPVKRRFGSDEGEFVFIKNNFSPTITNPQANTASINKQIEEIKIQIKELKYQGVTAIDDKPIDEYADSLINEIKLEEAAGTNKSSFNNIIMELDEKIALLEEKIDNSSFSMYNPKFIQGCLNSKAINYNPNANLDDNSCIILGNNSSFISFGEFSNIDSTLDIFIQCGTTESSVSKIGHYKLYEIILKVEGFEIIDIIDGELLKNSFSTKVKKGLFGTIKSYNYSKFNGAIFYTDKESLLLKAKVKPLTEQFCIIDVSISTMPDENVYIGDCLTVKLKERSGYATINYKSDTPIAGFQFKVSGVDVISAAYGAAAAAGFTTSTSNSMVLGFSLTGKIIPSGKNLLTVIDFKGDSKNIELTEIVVSDVAGKKSNAKLSIIGVVYE